MKIVSTKKRKTSINLTALVDILFLLIIFFSVSTSFTNQKSISVDLPRSIASDTVSKSEKLIIIMQDSKELFVNGELIPWEKLKEEISKSKYNRNQKVVLNIDKRISHGNVVALLDLLKINQFKKVVFGTYDKS